MSLFGLGFDHDDGDDGGGELVMMVTLGDARGKQLTAYLVLDWKGLVSPYQLRFKVSRFFMAVFEPHPPQFLFLIQ